MLIEKICPKCGKKYTTIDKFPDEVCEPWFDKHFKKIENNSKV